SGCGAPERPSAALTWAAFENGFGCCALETAAATTDAISTRENDDMVSSGKSDATAGLESRPSRRRTQIQARYPLYHSATPPWLEHAPCWVAASVYDPSLHLPDAWPGFAPLAVFGADVGAFFAASVFGAAPLALLVALFAAPLLVVSFFGASADLPAGVTAADDFAADF